MKKTPSADSSSNSEELASEYHFDYRKAHPNRLAAGRKPGSRVVLLDADVAEVFSTPESVNHVLRAVIEALPPGKR